MAEKQCLSRSQLLQQINEVSFAVNDIHLYLDTHPCDQAALSYFFQNNSRRRQLMEEYARAYGPLTIADAADSDSSSWQWSEQPFPWEQEGGGC